MSPAKSQCVTLAVSLVKNRTA